MNRADSDRVVGFHLLGPNAGEVTQAVGIAMKMGVTKDQWDSVVGIHPTMAEDILNLDKNKEEHGEAEKGNC